MANFSGMFGGQPMPGVLGGAMAGMRVPYEMQGADQALQEQQTKNLSDSEKLRMMIESENPTKTAENSLKTNQANAQNDPDLIKAAVAAQMAESQGKVTEQDDKLRASQRNFIKEMGDELNQKIQRGQNPYDPMDKTSKDQWDRWVQQAQKLKIPLPPVPDTQPDGSSKIIQDILTKTASMGEGSTDFQTKKAIATAPAQVQQVTQGNTNASNERIAAGNQASREEVQAMKTEAIKARQQQNQTVIQAVVASVQAGKEVPPALLNLAAEAAYNSANKDTPLGIRAIMIETDNRLTNDEKDAKKEDWKKSWIKQTFDQKANPTASTGATPQAQAAPQSNYTVGQVVKGYRFKGGDATKQSNWEKVN